MFQIILVSSPLFLPQEKQCLGQFIASEFPSCTLCQPKSKYQVAEIITQSTPASNLFLILNHQTENQELLATAHRLQNQNKSYIVYPHPIEGHQHKTASTYRDLSAKIRLEIQSMQGGFELEKVSIVVAKSNNPEFCNKSKELGKRIKLATSIQVEESQDLDGYLTRSHCKNVFIILNQEDLYRYSVAYQELSTGLPNGKVTVIVYSQTSAIPYGFKFDQLVTSFGQLETKINWLLNSLQGTIRPIQVKLPRILILDSGDSIFRSFYSQVPHKYQTVNRLPVTGSNLIVVVPSSSGSLLNGFLQLNPSCVGIVSTIEASPVQTSGKYHSSCKLVTNNLQEYQNFLRGLLAPTENLRTSKAPNRRSLGYSPVRMSMFEKLDLQVRNERRATKMRSMSERRRSSRKSKIVARPGAPMEWICMKNQTGRFVTVFQSDSERIASKLLNKGTSGRNSQIGIVQSLHKKVSVQSTLAATNSQLSGVANKPRLSSSSNKGEFHKTMSVALPTGAYSDLGLHQQQAPKKRDSTVGYNQINLQELVNSMGQSDLPGENNSFSSISSIPSNNRLPLQQSSNQIGQQNNYYTITPGKSSFKNAPRLSIQRKQLPNMSELISQQYSQPISQKPRRSLEGETPTVRGLGRRTRESILESVENSQLWDTNSEYSPGNIQMIFKTSNPHIRKLSEFFDNYSCAYRRFQSLDQLREICKSFNQETLTVVVIDDHSLPETLKILAPLTMAFYVVTAPSDRINHLQSILPKYVRFLPEEASLSSAFKNVSSYVRILKIDQLKPMDINTINHSGAKTRQSTMIGKPMVYYLRSQTHPKTLLSRAFPNKFNFVDYSSFEELSQMILRTNRTMKPIVLMNQHIYQEFTRETRFKERPVFEAILFQPGKATNKGCPPGVVIVNSNQSLVHEIVKISH